MKTIANMNQGMSARWRSFAILMASIALLIPLTFASLAQAVAPAVAAGANFTVVLTDDGTVWTWGDNRFGQLGDGTIVQRSTPVRVAGLTGVIAVAAGEGHVLALKGDGTVWGWGDNSSGQLGSSSYSTNLTPVKAEGLAGITAIAAGSHHSLALKSDGTLRAWGSNWYGQLGDGNTNSASTPVTVQNETGTGDLTGVTAIAAGMGYSMALKNGGVLSWGYNYYGELGDGTTTNHSRPAPVSGLTGMTAIAAGRYHAMALKNDGTLRSWGANWDGALGDGSNTGSPTPVTVKDENGTTSLSGVVAIAAGSGYSLARKSGGALLGWGGNSYGQLGDGTRAWRQLPAPAVGLNNLTVFAAGTYHNVALKSDSSIVTWGYNSWGQIGNGANTWRLSPVKVPMPFTISEVSAGRQFSLALLNDGTLRAWGVNNLGQLGNGLTIQSSIPVQVSGMSGVTHISAGENHGLARRDDGSVWGWGGGWVGQLGDGNSFDSSTPVQVKNSSGVGMLTGINNVAAGSAHSIALQNNGTVWAWGYNYYGQLGDGGNSNRNLPVQVKNSSGAGALGGVIAVAAGGFHSLALAANGTVWAWGYNDIGQLGDGSNLSSNKPVQVKDQSGTAPLSGIIAIAAGNSFSLALKNDGTVWGWGGNWGGQLGNGTSAASQLPSMAIISGISAMDAGASFSLGLESDGAVWSWGGNESGQLGSGRLDSSVLPTILTGLPGVASISAGGDHALALEPDGVLWAWGSNESGQHGDGISETLDLTTFSSHTITPSAGPGGTISPASPFQALTRARLKFTITPAAGNTVASVSGCGGTFRDGVYTSGPVTGSCTVLVTFAPQPGIAQAADTAGPVWITGGDALWNGQLLVSHDGVDAVASARLYDKQQSWLQTSISGPARVSFWWKVSSEENYDELCFYLDGARQECISGEVGWSKYSLQIQSGNHVFRWRYEKDGSISEGDDRAWLDGVTVAPSRILNVAITGSGGGTVASVPVGISCESGSSLGCSAGFDPGEEVTLLQAPDISSVFNGWSGRCLGLGNCTFVISANCSVGASFTLAPKIKVGTKSYNTFTEAYGQVSNGAVISSRVADFTENLLLIRPIAVTIRGGYDSLFDVKIGFSTLIGKLTIGSGSLVVEDLVIR